MLKDKISNYLFLDIETVPEYQNYEDVPEQLKRLWDKKSAYQRKADETAADFYKKAGIWAEFGKIICISCGFIDSSNTLRLKSFYGDEKDLLVRFLEMLSKFCGNNKTAKLCAHNGKEFDFPYIARRVLINGLNLPPVLDTQNMKPWEMPFVDTLDLWKFGDYKHYCSLELLATLFGIPSPKDDIDGSMVATVYYTDNNLERIVEYCEKDVITLTKLFLKIKQAPEFQDVTVV
ncbi:MAG: 3'-5' exonuclease, partial [Prevotellaceae bacterium]|nr:3'-5' exonuclease [Prevotellaceae bacterium]